MEVLQMGRIPIHIYEDSAHVEGKGSTSPSWQHNESWVPYELSVFPRVGYVTNLSGLPKLLRLLPSAPSAREMERAAEKTGYLADDGNRLMRRRALAIRLRSSHFSFEGVIKQISGFMLSKNTIRHYLHYDANGQSQLQDSEVSSAAKVWRVTGSDSDLVCRQVPQFPTSNRPGQNPFSSPCSSEEAK